MSNILIIKHGSLGDIAQASGAIQDISENHKEDQIHLLTTKPYFELFKKNPFIHNIILDKRLSRFNLIYLYLLMRTLKKLSIQKVYDLQNSSRTKFYKNILFPKANYNSWSSSETTLPNGTSKEQLDINVKSDDKLNNLFQSLKGINTKLWVIEDDKRMCEKNSDFTENFIKLSRDVHFLNDDRAKIKLEINNYTGSKIKEIKEYTSY